MKKNFVDLSKDDIQQFFDTKEFKDIDEEFKNKSNGMHYNKWIELLNKIEVKSRQDDNIVISRKEYERLLRNQK